MIIDVRRQVALKKYTGGFSFRYDCPKNLVLLPSAFIDGEVEVSGEFEIYEDDSVGVTLKISYTLKGECSYCLEEARQKVDYCNEILFVTDDDGENYSYDGLTINLTTAVNDAVLFSQPQILLCKPDCKGIEIK
ncbi:MAG: YceD family protein [Clostridia bacterium]|nr:YceD family protein [Clostridia bacterium]